MAHYLNTTVLHFDFTPSFYFDVSFLSPCLSRTHPLCYVFTLTSARKSFYPLLWLRLNTTFHQQSFHLRPIGKETPNVDNHLGYAHIRNRLAIIGLSQGIITSNIALIFLPGLAPSPCIPSRYYVYTSPSTMFIKSDVFPKYVQAMPRFGLDDLRDLTTSKKTLAC
jgi:hypothetical protein